MPPTPYKVISKNSVAEDFVDEWSVRKFLDGPFKPFDDKNCRFIWNTVRYSKTIKSMPKEIQLVQSKFFYFINKLEMNEK